MRTLALLQPLLATLIAAASLLSAALPAAAQQPGASTPAPAATPAPSKTPILDSLRLSPEPPAPAPDDASRRLTVGTGKDKKVVALGRRFAVLIGVGEAKIKGYDLTPLVECLKDSRELAARLRGSGYTVTLLSEEATAPTYLNVLGAVNRVCRDATADDQILIYASSHGGVINGDPSIALKDNFIKLKEIKKALAGSKALVRLILLDACRDQKGFPTETSEFRDIHTVLSCRPDESSLSIDGDMSVFTKVLIEGLVECRADRVKDGKIELDELLYYLDEHVPTLAFRIRPGHRQNPTRTVVDPRALNPVLATCSLWDQLQLAPQPNLQPVAVEGPVARGPRNDMIISAAIAGKITIGMGVDELVGQLGQPATPITFDKDGKDILMFTDQPKEGDITYIFMDKRVVSNVMVMYKKACEADFDAAASRQAVAKLLTGRKPSDPDGLLSGLDMPTLFARIGCPSSVLATTINDKSQLLTWADVPEEGSELTIKMESGKSGSVSVKKAAK
jgi:hypothetical protein